MDRVGLAAQVQQNHAHLAAIARVDGAGRVGHGDGVLQRQAAARPHLRFVARGQLDGQAGRHQARHARLEDHVFHRAQVHAGVFAWAVGVGGQDGGGVDALDSDLHSPLS